MPLTTTSEAGAPIQIQGPTATLIYDDWYPALRTSRLRPGKLATAMRFAGADDGHDPVDRDISQPDQP